MTSCPENQLIVRGAREHNLAGFDIALPRDSFIVITGVSGSGKSSLAFDTIFREGQRRFLKTMPSYARLFATGLACPIATSFSGLGPALAVGQRVFHKNPRSTVGTLTEVYDLLRLLMARLGTCEAGAVVSRGLFSFNTQEGACPVCLGLGVVDELDTDLIVSDPTKTLRQGALRVSTPNGYLMYSQVTLGVLDAVLRAHGGDVDTPWRDLTDEVRRVVFHGSQVQKIPFGKHPLESRMKWTGITARPRQEGYYRGLVPIMEEILKGKRNDSILRFVRTSQCPTCRGTRLRPEALAVRWRGHDIAELSRMTPPALNKFLHAHSSDQNKIEVLDPIRRDLSARCGLMEELGLSYLTFDRTAPSLSAGEAGRLRLASLLLGELRGLVLVLDEPSCELHPQDTTKLLGILQRLRDNGQTVIAVEHDPLAALAADWLVELGPGPGNKGGRLLWNGSPAEMLAADNLPLSPTKSLLLRSLPARPRRVEADLLGLPNLSCHNIENAHISLLRHGLNVVTGVSGAGKTSLLSAVIEALARSAPSAFDRVVSVDAEPIGRTPRSNPATYSNAFDAIRNLFAATPKAKEQGLSKSSFSFNTDRKSVV